MIKLILIGLAIGIISGSVAALCGVGGGLIMVPAYVMLLGVSQKVAVATSLAVIVPTALGASIVNARNGLVHGPLFLATVVGAVVTAMFFASKLKSFSDETLTKIFAVVVILMGLRMWFMEPPKPSTPTTSTAAVEASPSGESKVQN